MKTFVLIVSVIVPSALITKLVTNAWKLMSKTKNSNAFALRVNLMMESNAKNVWFTVDYVPTLTNVRNVSILSNYRKIWPVPANRAITKKMITVYLVPMDVLNARIMTHALPVTKKSTSSWWMTQFVFVTLLMILSPMTMSVSVSMESILVGITVLLVNLNAPNVLMLLSAQVVRAIKNWLMAGVFVKAKVNIMITIRRLVLLVFQ